MSRIHLDECAVEYAGSWATKERLFVTGLAGSNRLQRLDAVQRAGGYFRVSRSFKRAFDVDVGIPRLQPVLDVLDRLSTRAITENTLGGVVRDLRRDLGRPYGNRDLLSAATKFLWLLRRDVVVIHDRQARIALNAPSGDYDGYLELWHAAYSRRRDEVEAVCNRMSVQTERLAKSPTMDCDLCEIVQAQWFKRRVFDIYLWKTGAKMAAITT